MRIHAITANIQTIKDATPCIFNPSGLAARRQYLYSQMAACQADLICLQETRSKAGRWMGPGILTWRSGASKGQYGCEVWVRAAVVSPPLQLTDWRLLHATPRILCVTCVAPRCPVTIISAHAPHADRPDCEAKAFWCQLGALTRRVPAHRALIIGVDANGDFHAADEEGYLIGDLIAHGEPGRNDDALLEYCLTAGLEAPGTFSSVQQGPGWSWQHTSGRCKRLDHVLYRPGPWAHRSASQAYDFDIVNVARDHVALRVRSDLTCPRAPTPPSGPRKASPQELAEVSQRVWQRLSVASMAVLHRETMTAHLSGAYHAALQALPPKPPLAARQPYLQTDTLAAFSHLRDWRAQIRVINQGIRLTLMRAVWDTWQVTILQNFASVCTRTFGIRWTVLEIFFCFKALSSVLQLYS